MYVDAALGPDEAEGWLVFAIATPRARVRGSRFVIRSPAWRESREKWSGYSHFGSSPH
jgi:hypothetical protein